MTSLFLTNQRFWEEYQKVYDGMTDEQAAKIVSDSELPTRLQSGPNIDAILRIVRKTLATDKMMTERSN